MSLKQVEQTLLTSNELNISFLEQMVSNLVNRGVDFCDFYLQNATNESFALDEGIIKSGNFAIDQGIGVRAICKEKSFLSYSNSLAPKTISILVNDLFIEPIQNHKTNINHKIDELNLYTIANPINSHTSTEKIALLNKIDSYGRSYNYVTNVIANLSLDYEEIFIINNQSSPSSINTVF